MVGDSLTPAVSDQTREDPQSARKADVAARPHTPTPETDTAAAPEPGYSVFWLDLNGRVTRWTAECERVFGRSTSETLGRHFRDLFYEEDRKSGKPERALAETRENGAWDGVGWLLRQDGAPFWAAASVTLIKTPNGIDIGHMVVARELEPLIGDEGLTPDASRLVSLGRVATEVSHDVNNILTAIRGFAGLLERKLPAGGGSHQVWHELIRACDRGAELTQKVLGVASATADEAGVVSVVDLVRSMEPLLRQVIPNRILLTVSLEDGLPPIRGYTSDLELAILNLVVNARDAIPGEGTIALTVSGEGARDHIDRVVLSVRDSGVGMSREVRDRIFDRFFTTKAPGEGTGIGMTLVRDSVRAAGGWIEIESGPGSGTLVKLLLNPASEACTFESVDEPEAAIEAEQLAGRVLVCCGSKVLCDCAADLLTREGFVVTRAHTAAEATAFAMEETVGYDIAVVDLVLADATGPELLRRVRSGTSGPPTIFISDRSPEISSVLDEVALTDRVIFAPFSPEELLGTIQRLTAEENGRASSIH